MVRRLKGRRRSGPSVARGHAVFLACVGVALALAVVARSARPPTLSFGNPIGAGWPVEAGGYGDVGDIAIGDLTGDGRPDMAIVSPLDGSVSTLVNAGRGRFAGGHSYTITDFEANQLERVAIADLNGDGKRDLVTMRAAGDQILSVLLNRGRGDFSPPVDYSSGRAPVHPALALADLNGDARPEIVVAGVKTFVVLFNNGDGTLRAPVAYSTVTQPYEAAVGDLNGDGNVDLLTANSRAHTVSLFLNEGDGTFGAGTDYTTGGAGAAPNAVALADFNGDHKLDAATGNRHGVSLLLNRGAGRLSAPHHYGGDLLDAVDMNGDGRPDLVGGGDIRLNRGDGTFEPPLFYFYPDAIGDFNRDGRPDLVFPTFSDRNGQWSLWVRLDSQRACDVQPAGGQTMAVAARMLALANCRVGRIGYTHSAKIKKGRVISQKPASFSVLRKGANVDLVVSLGRKR